MTEQLFIVLTIVAGLGLGLIGGVFFAFSTFVMRALARIAPAAGMSAMQSINIAVINPMFLGVFLGTAAVCLATGLAAILRWDMPGSGWVLAGSVLYLIGTLGVTIVCNVPLNNALARVEPSQADAPEVWAGYVRRWTIWNHVRTLAALAAAGSFTIAARVF